MITTPVDGRQPCEWLICVGFRKSWTALYIMHSVMASFYIPITAEPRYCSRNTHDVKMFVLLEYLKILWLSWALYLCEVGIRGWGCAGCWHTPASAWIFRKRKQLLLMLPFNVGIMPHIHVTDQRNQFCLLDFYFKK